MAEAVRITKMKDEDYPGLYQCADVISIHSQKVYLILQRAYLGSLILGSVLGSFTAFGSAVVNIWLYTAMAIILTLGLLLLWIIRARQDDKAWFDGRAIAESIKTATWRFMMKAQPFQADEAVEDCFIDELRGVRSARSSFEKHLAAAINPYTSAITDVMWQIRSASLKERKGFYTESRVRDQKSWYSHKAKTNAKMGARWFWTTVALQAVAVVTAIIQAVAGGLGFKIVPVLATCAAAVTAWSQTKRYDELAQSYALAAQELEELESIANNLKNDDDFPQLVEQIEEAISREHTMWCARRDVRLSGRSPDRKQ
jgi:anti-sigma-K factor RskA